MIKNSFPPLFLQNENTKDKPPDIIMAINRYND